MGWLEERAERKLDDGEQIEQPDLACPLHQNKAGHRDRAPQVGIDQNLLTVKAVGQHTGKG